MKVPREDGARSRRLRVMLLAAAAIGLAQGAGPAAAGDLYKCGKNFQDRPCENSDVQQRFSRTQGTFAIEQVNPNTDRDCARIAAEAMGWWTRLAAGESIEKLHGEIQAQPRTSRYDKSLMRDVVTIVGGYRGTPREVRSQFESQCMVYKARNGYPTEREMADGAARRTGREDAAAAQAAQAARRNTEVELRRMEADARRAEAETRRVDAANRLAVERVETRSRQRLP